MAEERLMTRAEEREYHVFHKRDRRPNKFAKDTIKKRNTDYYSYWRSADAQLTHQIGELKRKAREEEMKKRANKKKKEDVDGGEN
jgi:hypothetical protein